MTRNSLFFATVLGLMLLISDAQAQLGFPIILSAAVDSSNNTLTISGQNFGSVSAVKFGIVPLNVTTSTPTAVVAQLPPSTKPGSYVILASFSNGLAVFATSFGAISSQPAGLPVAHGYLLCTQLFGSAPPPCGMTVPVGVTSMSIEAWGGGTSGLWPTSLAGGYCKAALSVTPGDTLFVTVGAGGGRGALGLLSGGDTTVVSGISGPLILVPGGGSGSVMQCPGIGLIAPFPTPPFATQLPLASELSALTTPLATSAPLGQNVVGGNGYLTVTW